jgi:hypothetical protein
MQHWDPCVSIDERVCLRDVLHVAEAELGRIHAREGSPAAST